MSCSFWNMRRKLRKQQQEGKLIADIAKAQEQAKAEEEAVKQTRKTTARKAGVKNDGTAGGKS